MCCGGVSLGMLHVWSTQARAGQGSRGWRDVKPPNCGEPLVSVLRLRKSPGTHALGGFMVLVSSGRGEMRREPGIYRM